MTFCDTLLWVAGGGAVAAMPLSAWQVQRMKIKEMDKQSKIILVTGGQKSGKSEFAERMALGLSDCPVYMATAKVMDEEFAKRVQIHKERRQQQWENIEEERLLSKHKMDGRVVLVDCVTLWATNFFFEHGEDIDRAYNALEQEFCRLAETEGATFLFVTNEIGWGGVSANTMQRRFADLQGRANQLIAAQADEVYMLVSGIPVKIK